MVREQVPSTGASHINARVPDGVFTPSCVLRPTGIVRTASHVESPGRERDVSVHLDVERIDLTRDKSRPPHRRDPSVTCVQISRGVLEAEVRGVRAVEERDLARDDGVLDALLEGGDRNAVGGGAGSAPSRT